MRATKGEGESCDCGPLFSPCPGRLDVLTAVLATTHHAQCLKADQDTEMFGEDETAATASFLTRTTLELPKMWGKICITKGDLEVAAELPQRCCQGLRWGSRARSTEADRMILHKSN